MMHDTTNPSVIVEGSATILVPPLSPALASSSTANWDWLVTEEACLSTTGPTEVTVAPGDESLAVVGNHSTTEVMPATDMTVPDSLSWRKCSIAELLNAEARPIPWIVEGFFARDECVILNGAAKVGKSWLLLRLAMDLALGRPALGRYAVSGPGRILWIDEEMGSSNIQRRMQRLRAGLQLTAEDVALLDRNFDLRPQQGFSLYDPRQFDQYRRVLGEGRPDVVIMDSLVAMQQGDEKSNDKRREFYNRFVAPFKTDRAFVLTSHPPLPSANAAPGTDKRPRGAGDSLAFTDRVYHLSAHSKAPERHVVLVKLEEIVAREGGGVEPQLVALEGAPEGPMTVVSHGAVCSAASVSSVTRCQEAIVRILETATDREMYQPDLKSGCGFDKDTYQEAFKGLGGRVQLLEARKGHGSGKWVRMAEPSE